MQTPTNQPEVKHNKFKEIIMLAIARTSEGNPYPLDIFIGETKEGKIGKHCHDVWNNCLNKFWDNINELLEENAPNQSQQNENVENGGSLSQRSSVAFEPLARRSCDSARNLKSKEAPKIINKYGRQHGDNNSDADEPERRHENITGETTKAESSADNIHTQIKKEMDKDYEQSTTNIY